MTSRPQHSAVIMVLIVLTIAPLAGCEQPFVPVAERVLPMKAITPPTEADIRESIRHGVEFLISIQKTDGHWGSMNPAMNNIWMPGYRETEGIKMAVTALAVKALLETEADTPEAKASLDRGVEWLLKNLPIFRRQSTSSLFNNWGHAYAIEALVVMLDKYPMDAAEQETVRDLIRDQIRLLEAWQSIRGGWGYYTPYPHTRPPQNWGVSFLTATAVISFYRAEEAGIDVPDGAIKLATRALKLARFPNGAFSYNIHMIPQPQSKVSMPQGAASRSQPGALALYFYGHEPTNQQVLKATLTRLISEDPWLSVPRKERHPHSGEWQIAGYYYYYGQYYGAQIIEHLAPADQETYRHQLSRIIVDRQDQDGSWWDFIFLGYHHEYGTAMALMALQNCLPPADVETE
jgi:hypothetical protein